MMPKTIQTMAWAYKQICVGEDPWTALGNFTNAWYDYAKDIRADLVSEPLAEVESITEHTLRWRAFCAASVEFLCNRYDVPCPEWVHNSRYILATPWWHTSHPHSISIRERLMRDTPESFAKRNIFCGNRLYQNKYEMNTWVQEARAKGMTGPGEAWRYARQKEISIHGA
jgi:hypothetical protein